MATAAEELPEPLGHAGNSIGTRKIMSPEGPSTSSAHAMKKTIGHRGIDPTGETTYKKGPSTSSAHAMKKTIGHRGINPTGETTYKKTTSSALKGAIQLGITHTVGGLSSKPERDVLLQDFEVVESIFFPSEGSNLTPAHHYGDFRFKTYAPIAFRYFREMFGIRPDDYMLCKAVRKYMSDLESRVQSLCLNWLQYSLCNETLIELSNSGASGSLFYVSSDDEFIIKTVQHKEAEFLQKLLPGYFMNLNQNKRTLLPKFYGLYCVQAGGNNIRIAVMNNLLPSAVRMHFKYDLKGSTHKRRASAKEREKATPTYKDLDFMQDMTDGLLLEGDKYNALCKTIQRDCLLLQSFKIMDYSLLVGIHNVECREQANEEAVAGALDQRRPQGQKSLYSTALESIQGESGAMGSLNTDDHDQTGGIPAQTSKGERLLLYVGIIDILQSYRLVKMLEHSWKALVHDGDTVSVHRPGFYAERFQKFMCNRVFRKISLKTSPSKKRRAVGPGTLKKANVAGSGPAQFAFFSSNSQQPAVQQDVAESKADTEEDDGRPDLLPNILPRDDLAGSSMGNSGNTPTNPPSPRSLGAFKTEGVEGPNTVSTDQEPSTHKRAQSGALEESIGAEDAITQ